MMRTCYTQLKQIKKESSNKCKIRKTNKKGLHTYYDLC